MDGFTEPAGLLRDVLRARTLAPPKELLGEGRVLGVSDHTVDWLDVRAIDEGR